MLVGVLKMLENYRLVNSENVQNKAERLGYINRIKPDKGNDFFLILEKGEYRASNNYHYVYPEITQKDFLALPEPLKVGDWVKFTNIFGSMIFRIDTIDDDYTFDNITSCCNSNILSKDKFLGYRTHACTKLTPEQIKILKLEEN